MLTTRDRFTTTRQAGFLGARIDGVDIANLSDADLEYLKDAFRAHAVICLSGQDCAPETYAAFGERWGEPISDGGRTVEGFPNVGLLHNVGPKLTDVWHTDLSFRQQPPLATMLMALVIPPAGGDTLFASQVEAYRQLSDGMKDLLGRYSALHVDLPRAANRPFEERERALHPIVRIVEGEPALYINGMYTHAIDGLTVEESRPLLQWLTTYCTQPNFTYRHRWTVGDLLIWDNRRVQHFAIYDYSGAERKMHRLVIK